MVAAGRLGQGRLVAFGHNGYFGQEALETGDTRQLMFNAVRWLGGTDAPRVAERFELYACGVELANGFAELTDPSEQRRRFAADMDEKERIHGERYPLDEDFLAALAHMPEASGVALGLDRLVMLATGATHIDQVQWTPLAGAET